MKKFSYLLITAATLIIVACSTKKEEKTASGGMSEKAKENLAVAHQISDAIQTNNVAVIDSIVAADYVSHSDRGDMNRDSLKSMIVLMSKQNTNMKMEITKELADDDYVMMWMRFTGNHDGSMMKAGPYDFAALQTMRFKDGKVVEHWEFMEPREMMKMMQAMTPQPSTNK